MCNMNDFKLTCSNSDMMHGTPSSHLCRLLWVGNSPGGNFKSFPRVLIVVSHCLQGLEWLPKYLDGVDIYNLTIFTKCDKPVTGIPNNTIIKRIPNVGRNDHTFAYAISHLDESYSSLRSGDVVVFLKDDMSSSNIHQIAKWRSLKEMLRIASVTGFSCGMEPTDFENGSVSVFHSTPILRSFSLKIYGMKKDLYTGLGEEIAFQSRFNNLGEWSDDLTLPIYSTNLTPVCYGGVFTASIDSIRRVDESIWKDLTHSLSRGNSIEEGHFAERTWASLLSPPLTKNDIKNIWSMSHEVMRWYGAYMGTLIGLKSKGNMVFS